ncbi:MAG: DNA polymerase I [Planctomycetota bacterium]|nr:MAG: DNA polymerase I [Planctomycetota bacterium]
MAETLYLVDSLSLLFQVYHAIRQPMTGRRGQPTNAVFGFVGDLQHLLEECKPTYLICAFDAAGPGERAALYEDYKANRKEMPDDLAVQIEMAKDIVAAYGIPVIEHEGWEADDVIATLTRQARERGIDVVIVSNDKDLRQLLGPGVRMYNIRKRRFFTEEDLRREWGIRPDQVVDFLALVGDSSDNVPGVPLVGPKKAAALLQRFGTLDGVLEHADEAPGKKLRENLKSHAAVARLSRRLVRLRDDLPLEFDLAQARVDAPAEGHRPDYARLLELFNEFGFRRYAAAIEKKLAEQAGGEAESPHRRRWELVNEPLAFERLMEALRRQKKFCLDLETTGLEAISAEIVGWAVCWENDVAYYVPVDGPPGQPLLDRATVRDAMRPLLEDPNVQVVNQNLKYEINVLRRAGITLRGLGVDPMVGDYLLDAGARSHNLERLARKYLGRGVIPISRLIGSGRQQKKMFEVDLQLAAEYASEDADLAWQLAQRIEQELRREGLWELYWELERPLIAVLADMEWRGIAIDVEELQRQATLLRARMDELREQIYRLAGREFNVDSPKQLAEVLFDDLKLPALKRTQTGYSTDQEVLDRLAALHALPEKVLQYRRLAKLVGTYVEALPRMVHPETGRIHASFNQVVTATGRLSSSNPNLQNIPIRSEEGLAIRAAFVAGEPDWWLLTADYSQIELRLLAHFSRDPELLGAFEANEDIHRAVAARIFSVPPNEVTADQRRIAKAVNFGVIYGQSPFGLAAALRIPQEEAARFIEEYFARYRRVAEYLETVLDDCRRRGYAETILGRRRAITGIRPADQRSGQRNLAERTAINTVIQGSAADLIKKAMVNIHRRLQQLDFPAYMILQIHDELMFEAPREPIAELAALVRDEMENALDLCVPLVVDVAAGRNWRDTQPLTG